MPVASPRRPAALPLGLLAAVLAAGALLATGVGLLAGLLGRDPEAPADDLPSTLPEGQVAIPVSGRDLAAYARVAREDVWDARRGRLALIIRPRAFAEQAGAITDLGRLVGRVLARDKRAGFVFTEKDFLPEGTRPGIVAGIPAGKRALRLEAGRIAGLVGLNPGDRFDVVATQALDAPAAGPPGGDLALGGPYGALLSRQLAQQQQARRRQAVVRVIVQGGVVVTPLETRAVPVSTSSLTGGARTTTRPVQEMVVAVDPREVAPLTEALAVDAQLTCLPRSGRPDDVPDSVTPGSEPTLTLPGAPGPAGGGQLPPLTVLDRIAGDARDLEAVPAAGAGGRSP